MSNYEIMMKRGKQLQAEISALQQIKQIIESRPDILAIAPELEPLLKLAA